MENFTKEYKKQRKKGFRLPRKPAKASDADIADKLSVSRSKYQGVKGKFFEGAELSQLPKEIRDKVKEVQKSVKGGWKITGVLHKQEFVGVAGKQSIYANNVVYTIERNGKTLTFEVPEVVTTTAIEKLSKAMGFSDEMAKKYGMFYDNGVLRFTKGGIGGIKVVEQGGEIKVLGKGNMRLLPFQEALTTTVANITSRGFVTQRQLDAGVSGIVNAGQVVKNTPFNNLDSITNFGSLYDLWGHTALPHIKQQVKQAGFGAEEALSQAIYEELKLHPIVPSSYKHMSTNVSDFNRFNLGFGDILKAERNALIPVNLQSGTTVPGLRERLIKTTGAEEMMFPGSMLRIRRSKLPLGDDAMYLMEGSVWRLGTPYTTYTGPKVGIYGNQGASGKLKEAIEKSVEIANQSDQVVNGRTIKAGNFTVEDFLEMSDVERKALVSQASVRVRRGDIMGISEEGEYIRLNRNTIRGSGSKYHKRVPTDLRGHIMDIKVRDGELQAIVSQRVNPRKTQVKLNIAGDKERNAAIIQSYENIVDLLEGQAVGEDELRELRRVTKDKKFDLLIQDDYFRDIKSALKKEGIELASDGKVRITAESMEAAEGKAMAKAMRERLGAIAYETYSNAPKVKKTPQSTSTSLRIARLRKAFELDEVKEAMGELERVGIKMRHTQTGMIDFLVDTQGGGYSGEQMLGTIRALSKLVGDEEALRPLSYIGNVAVTDVTNQAMKLTVNADYMLRAPEFAQGMLELGAGTRSGVDPNQIGKFLYESGRALRGEVDPSQVTKLADISIAKSSRTAGRNVFMEAPDYLKHNVIDLGTELLVGKDSEQMAIRYLHVPGDAVDMQMFRRVEGGYQISNPIMRSLHKTLNEAKKLERLRAEGIAANDAKYTFRMKEASKALGQYLEDLGVSASGGYVKNDIYKFTPSRGMSLTARQSPMNTDWKEVRRLLEMQRNANSAAELEAFYKEAKAYTKAGHILPGQQAFSPEMILQQAKRGFFDAPPGMEGPEKLIYDKNKKAIIDRMKGMIASAKRGGDMQVEYIDDLMGDLSWLLSRQPVQHHGLGKNILVGKPVVVAGRGAERILGKGGNWATDWLTVAAGMTDFDWDTLYVNMAGSSAKVRAGEVYADQLKFMSNFSGAMADATEAFLAQKGANWNSLVMEQMNKWDITPKTTKVLENLITAAKPYVDLNTSINDIATLLEDQSEQSERLVNSMLGRLGNQRDAAVYGAYLRTKAIGRLDTTANGILNGIANNVASDISMTQAQEVLGAMMQMEIWYKRGDAIDVSQAMSTQFVEKIKRLSVEKDAARADVLVEDLVENMWRPQKVNQKTLQEFSDITAMLAGTKGKMIDVQGEGINTLEMLLQHKIYMENKAASADTVRGMARALGAVQETPELITHLVSEYALTGNEDVRAKSIVNFIGNIFAQTDNPSTAMADAIGASIGAEKKVISYMSESALANTSVAKGFDKAIEAIGKNKRGILLGALGALGIAAIAGATTRNRSFDDVPAPERQASEASPAQPAKRSIYLGKQDGGMNIRANANTYSGVRLQSYLQGQGGNNIGVFADNVDMPTYARMRKKAEMYGLY